MTRTTFNIGIVRRSDADVYICIVRGSIDRTASSDGRTDGRNDRMTVLLNYVSRVKVRSDRTTRLKSSRLVRSGTETRRGFSHFFLRSSGFEFR